MLKKDEEIFVRYYDLLFTQKDYRGEVDFLVNAYKKHHPGKLNRILDVGCGTGSHTLELAKMGYDITGVDISKPMIKTAQDKLKKTSGLKIKFIEKDIAKLLVNEKFDMAFSMFYVVNYIDSLTYLKNFFSHIHSKLKRGGIYSFDCWNGVATILDPPLNKKINVKTPQGVIIQGELNPNYNSLMNTSSYLYELNINDRGKKYRVLNPLTQTYWLPLILKQLLLEAGFRKVNIYKHLTLDAGVTSSDYKLCFVSIS